MDANGLREFSYEDLEACTGGFSEENFVGNFHLGRLFRGKVGDQHVSVKIWNPCSGRYRIIPPHNKSRLEDEIALLCQTDLKYHPNMIRMIGYCWQGDRFGAVYDLKPLNTVHNLLTDDWLEENDIFAFGVILIELIAKKMYLDDYLDVGELYTDEQWASEEFERRKEKTIFRNYKCSLVDESLAAETVYQGSDGYKITKLALSCVDEQLHKRPSMKEVVKSLRKLHVVYYQSKDLGMSKSTGCGFGHLWVPSFLRKKKIYWM